MQPVPIDSTASAEIRVALFDLASTLQWDPGDQFPAVFATARMIALMEVASARVLRPHLDEGELSVGVAVDVVHTAATLPGSRVTANARLVRQEGKLFVFEVSASDEGGEIGRGMHKRAVIIPARLMAGAAKRSGDKWRPGS
jgi:predicted thioesterase